MPVGGRALSEAPELPPSGGVTSSFGDVKVRHADHAEAMHSAWFRLLALDVAECSRRREPNAGSVGQETVEQAGASRTL